MAQNLADVDPSSEVAKQFGPALKAFNAFQLLGLVGSILCLISARFSSVPRQAPWWNFMISWVVFCTSYLLLFFAGQAYDSEPNLSLCITQSSLTYAASPFACATALGLVIQLFFNVKKTLSGEVIRGERHWRITLLILPYIIFTILILESTVITLADPDPKFSSVSYCSLESRNHIPGRITSAFDVMLVIPILPLNFIIYLCFRKHWSTLRTGNFTSMFVRVSAFTFFGLITVIIGIIFFTGSNSNAALVELDTILALIPVAAVVIFGSHKDLFEVWMFWRKRNKQFLPPAYVMESRMKTLLPPIPPTEYVIHIE